MTLARRLFLACLVLAVAQVAGAPDALADAAGPTDYNSIIVSVEPADAPISIEMIGGDAFISMDTLEPVEVIVLGYKGEPYLRFDPDGTVYENRRSPAVWLNQERYGNEQPPSIANAEALPQWFEVASGGSYAWHDHRSHWMSTVPPPGAEAGDQILEAAVPMTVDGTQVTVTVASFMLASPSMLPSVAGVAAAIAAVAALRPRGRVAHSLGGLGVAALAGVFGTIAFLSVPAVTAPSMLLWLLPVLAIAALVVQLLVRNNTATTVYLDGLLVAAGALIVGWGVFRFDALRRALIPSNAPAGLDRVVIALALIAGAALAVQGLMGLVRPQRLLDVTP